MTPAITTDLVRPPRPRRAALGYLGWIGFGNMGDEAIHRALVAALPDIELVPLPLGVRAGLRSVRHIASYRGTAVLLGGGTVVGRRIWRVHLAQALLLTGGPARMVGAGVEDPSFTRPGHLSEARELQRWRRLLARFPRVTVRGPRSARLLADVGVESEVIGDPALLLDPDGPLAPTEPDLIGINLGASDDLWGHDQGAVVTEVATALARLATRGWRFRALVVNGDDEKHTRQCARRAGLGGSRFEIVAATDPQAFLHSVAACRLVVAERLHAAVLAARLGIPTVTLAYQPKCLDFAESVGIEDLAIRTDEVSSGPLAEVIADATSREVALRHHLDRRVEHLRQRLRAETTSLAAELGC